MPEYSYKCYQCEHTLDISETISERKARKSVKCPKCKKQMSQIFTGGAGAFMSCQTIGSAVDRNTGRMSLDEKIHVGTKKYQDLNPMLNPDMAREDRKANIEREIAEITQGHR